MVLGRLSKPKFWFFQMAKLQDDVNVLIFDTWGTVVDWRGSVLDELCAFGQRKGLKIDWEAFLEEWRSAYGPAKEKVNSGELPWTTMDVFYRQALVQLLGKYNIKGFDEGDIEHLNRAWTRTRPWPDSVAGLTLLKRRYIVSPLSNASFAWLIDIARFASLPFDCVVSSENARWYKPRREVYLTAVKLLGRKPEQVMLSSSTQLRSSCRTFARAADWIHSTSDGIRPASKPGLPGRGEVGRDRRRHDRPCPENGSVKNRASSAIRGQA